MYIYKFTHKETNKCYIGQTIQDPNQQRLGHMSASKPFTKWTEEAKVEHKIRIQEIANRKKLDKEVT